jgi:charged multivesicular body protein 3
METIRGLLWKPTPEEQVHNPAHLSTRQNLTCPQKRKCNALVRQNVRKLDRDIQQLKSTEQKTKTLIQQSSKRAQRNPAMAKQANQDVRIFARELIRVRKQNNRLMTSKAQLNSVQMQVNEAFSVRKIEGSIKASTGIMKDVNSLVRLPELTGTMRELSSELMKAGIIEEMLDDTLGENEMLEGEADEEVDKVLSEVLKDRLPASKAKEEELPAAPQPEEEEEENQEELLAQMRGRLEALKS